MGMKTLFAGVAAISAALCANAAGLSGDTGTTFAGLTAETAFDATQAENDKYFWRTEATSSVGTIESYTTLGAYSGTRATQWGSTDASGVALKLDTETPLIRLAEGTAAVDGETSTIDANGVYIDTLVQFGVYYETPDMVDGAKFGIWGQEIEGTVKLVVRAGKYVNESLTANDYIVSTDSNFDFEAWHRITVKTSVSDGKTMFKLFIDGAAAVATTGETEFPGLVAATTISSLVFNGCGAVDDILFTKTVPDMDAVASVGGINYASLAAAVAGANGATVTLLKSSSENITIEAGDTLKILPASGVSYTGQVSIGDNNYNVVMATDPTTGEITYSTEKKGMILLITQGGDETRYGTLAEAVEAAAAGDTIKLLEAVALTSTITNTTNDLTLDLNGFNVTATDCRAFHVKCGATTITGTGTISTDVTQGTALKSSSSVIRVGSDTAATQFTLGENVTVTSPYCYGITYFGTQPQTVTLNGTVSVTGVQAAISGNGTAEYAATTLVVNGTVTATQDYAIYNPQAGTTTINGTVNGGIEVKAGAVTIADGATVSALSGATPGHTTNNNGTSTSGYAIAAVGNSSYKQPASAEIQDGATVNGQVIVLAENNSSTSGNIASYSNQIAIPADYKWVESGDGYTLVEKTYVAQIGNNKYETLAEAVAAAQSGATVTLTADTTLSARVEPNLGANTTLTIDLGGKTITRTGTSGNGSVFDVKSGAVTIKNGTIDCTQDDTEIAKDGVYAITARSGSEIVLETLTITVDSECGACVYPFAGATATIKSGTYANRTTTPYRYKLAWTGMAVNQPNSTSQILFIEGGTFSKVNPALGDDSGTPSTFLADGYITEETAEGSGIWVVALAPSGYDSGDGVSTFTIDETAEADVKTKTGAADLGAQVPGKTYSYAQAYAAGLIDLTAAEPIKELKPVIEIDAATNKVKVGFDTKPLNGFTITLAVYAATEPGAVDKATAQNFEVDGNGEVQLTAPIDRATNETKKFYKVKIVKIENK